MTLKNSTVGVLAVVAAAIVAAAPVAATDSKPPRIVAAVMQDTDGDTRADRLRVTYSERVRHAADRDGKYPIQVAGYRIRSVGQAGGKSLVVTLVEKKAADDAARPAVRYRPTGSEPVKDRAGNQALRQTFTATRAHGVGPTGPTPVTPEPNPQGTPTSTDRDGDGTPNEQDCAPDDPKRSPKAVDLPDLAFVDSNCDGIDGTERNAIFVSPQGNDANPGTRAAPKREIIAAVEAAAGKGKYVVAAAGVYRRVAVVTGTGIYGGYDPTSWARGASRVTLISGSPEAIYARNATDVVLQLLRVRGATQSLQVPPGMSFYGIRAVDGSSLTLQRVSVSAATGEPGADGTNGAAGTPGRPGGDGGDGQCGGSRRGSAGAAGASPAGFPGGAGGFGGADTGGLTGTGGKGVPGAIGTPGGAGGPAGDPGHDGTAGDPGSGGSSGVNGSGGSGTLAGANQFWVGQGGADGTAGGAGHGGGGGGGGGGQVCTFCNNGAGNGGGGGGGGGAGGGRGTGGGPGGGSFGLYLLQSTVTVSDSSSITAGNGGAGGRGGDGGLQGVGGSGGLGATYCSSEIGVGGNGGPGGFGGRGGGGGGGAGGPSIAVFKVVGSTVTVSTDSALAHGTPGAGGAGGLGENDVRNPGGAGIVHLNYG